jgi:hypothetical protein
MNSAGTTGDIMHTSNYTGSGSQGMGGLTSNLTGHQSTVSLPTGLGNLTPGGLPATNLDSFVYNAGGSAFLIYGDEGDMGPPPLFEFLPMDRIGAGNLSGQLSTGHGSNLPSAWGADEFIGGEFSMSGMDFAAAATGVASALAEDMTPSPAEPLGFGGPETANAEMNSGF